MTKSADAQKPRLLVVANLDRFMRNHLKPHLVAIREAGFQVDIACRVSQFAEEVQGYCDNLYHVPMRRNPVHPANVFALERLTKIVRNGRYDIVHSHTPVGGMLGRIAASRCKVPIRIYMAHGFHFHPEGNPLANLVFSRLEVIAGQRWSDLVEVINHDDYESALTLKIASADKLVWLPGPGVNTRYYDPATVAASETAALRRDLCLPDEGPVLGVVAELIPRKRVDDAIRALALLRKDYPGATLIILGSGPERKRLEDLAHSLGVGASCRFPGFRRELPVYYSLMDLFIFPTKQEGLPCALMEAMSMGLPVVATDIRGNRDIVTEGKTGILIPTEQPQALAGACRRLLADPANARQMGLRGQALIRKEFDTQLTVARQLEIYEQALLKAQAEGRLAASRPFTHLAETLGRMARTAGVAR